MAELSARTTNRRSGGLAVIAAAAVLGLAACGGSGSPEIAKLANNGRDGHGGGGTAIVEASGNHSQRSTGNDPLSSTTRSARIGGTEGSTTTLPKGNATQLLDEWAACMRAHGDPGQVDPTVDAKKYIDITIAPTIQGGYAGYSGEYGSGGPGVFCRSYLTAAQITLGGTPNAKPDEAKLLKYSECMRANGIPDFPDPSGGNLTVSINAGGDLDPNNPTFRSIARLCAEKTGAHALGAGTPPPGTIRVNGLGPRPVANG
jgi:hypothetical protein